MATSRELAARRMRSLISDLWLSRSKGRTPEQIDLIDEAIRRVQEEYFALIGHSPSGSYAEITGKLKEAEAALKKIREGREDFTNLLVSASKLLGSLTGVLKLIR
jgi:hypothetical protein